MVEILLNHGADIEAQSERTKDTPLSLACSGGRFEVVELLLTRGSNKEHRNVSDYTPLSLAASGGYVNIIKLLLTHGAEINSRTGSKLGISPLMLAAMNGHTGEKDAVSMWFLIYYTPTLLVIYIYIIPLLFYDFQSNIFSSLVDDNELAVKIFSKIIADNKPKTNFSYNYNFHVPSSFLNHNLYLS